MKQTAWRENTRYICDGVYDGVMNIKESKQSISEAWAKSLFLSCKESVFKKVEPQSKLRPSGEWRTVHREDCGTYVAKASETICLMGQLKTKEQQEASWRCDVLCWLPGPRTRTLWHTRMQGGWSHQRLFEPIPREWRLVKWQRVSLPSSSSHEGNRCQTANRPVVLFRRIKQTQGSWLKTCIKGRTGTDPYDLANI